MRNLIRRDEGLWGGVSWRLQNQQTQLQPNSRSSKGCSGGQMMELASHLSPGRVKTFACGPKRPGFPVSVLITVHILGQRDRQTGESRVSGGPGRLR